MLDVFICIHFGFKTIYTKHNFKDTEVYNIREVALMKTEKAERRYFKDMFTQITVKNEVLKHHLFLFLFPSSSLALSLSLSHSHSLSLSKEILHSKCTKEL